MDTAKKTAEAFRFGPQAAPAPRAPSVRQQTVRCKGCGGGGWFEGGYYGTGGYICPDCNGDGEMHYCLGCNEVAGSPDCLCTTCPEDGEQIPYEGVCPEAASHGRDS